MFARIAHFEGGSPEVVEREVERLRHDITDMQRGVATDPAALALSRVVDRVVMLVDRANAASTTIVFCDSEEKLHEADRILQEMSPQAGEGRRVARDLYEVALDEAPRAQRRAA
jgi:hypothetical protein